MLGVGTNDKYVMVVRFRQKRGAETFGNGGGGGDIDHWVGGCIIIIIIRLFLYCTSSIRLRHG